MISAQTAEVIGSAVHCWVLVNAEARHMIDLRQIPALWELPVHAPERKTRLRRLTLPETMTAAGAVRVTGAEIDDNGHMNNVAYVRRAQGGCARPVPRLGGRV